MRIRILGLALVLIMLVFLLGCANNDPKISSTNSEKAESSAASSIFESVESEQDVTDNNTEYEYYDKYYDENEVIFDFKEYYHFNKPDVWEYLLNDRTDMWEYLSDCGYPNLPALFDEAAGNAAATKLLFDFAEEIGYYPSGVLGEYVFDTEKHIIHKTNSDCTGNIPYENIMSCLVYDCLTKDDVASAIENNSQLSGLDYSFCPICCEGNH